MILSEKIQEMIDAAELLHDELESTISAVNEANRPVLSKLKNMSFLYGRNFAWGTQKYATNLFK